MSTWDEYAAGEGRHRVWLRKLRMDRGLVYVLGGGESSHIGGWAYREPGGQAEARALEGHRDIEVLQPLADAACLKHGMPVLVTGGIHVDDASRDDIDLILKNCRELMRCI